MNIRNAAFMLVFLAIVSCCGTSSAGLFDTIYIQNNLELVKSTKKVEIYYIPVARGFKSDQVRQVLPLGEKVKINNGCGSFAINIGAMSFMFFNVRDLKEGVYSVSGALENEEGEHCFTIELHNKKQKHTLSISKVIPSDKIIYFIESLFRGYF